jgi:hypothetical protein
MIRSRPKPKVQRGPAPLSDDRFDKFVAAMNWHVGRRREDPGTPSTAIRIGNRQSRVAGCFLTVTPAVTPAAFCLEFFFAIGI